MKQTLKNIPNAVTCVNVAAGVLAIISAARGNADMWGLRAYEWAFIFIGIAAVADFMDGFAARALHAYSNLGKELDSLCDLVSFGVAPAVLLFRSLEIAETPDPVKWLAVLIPVCGALRLAKFNIDTRQTTSFIGLPIPANAIFWVGYVALCYSGAKFVTEWYVALVAILAMSLLMLANLPLFSLKFKTWGFRENKWRWILVATAVALVACMGLPGLMWLVIAYVCYGLFAA
ncbi:MAG: CDP-diacylglycerol--serine O-phosphatidyltransferase [Candidatus Amulumruptor caecigallinarius]|nr:CDP-diacylglycerol--serine O-phosphatidyltransferase [Candidatus Amulumruptor caecigallinarius]